MSAHKVQLSWQRQTESFAYGDYNREHEWHFDNGAVVAASAASQFLGKPEFVDPEEAFVASLSSCHMLTFLAICARRRMVVDSYRDDAVGYLEENEDGKLAITRVTLNPVIVFGEGGKVPNEAQLQKIHHQAHHQCFLANSVKTEIRVADR